MIAHMANKFGAKKTEVGGEGFPSKGEAACYQMLLLDPTVVVLARQVRVSLTDAKIVYIPDFKCQDLETLEIFYVEYKGYETDSWRLKRRLWKHYGPGRLLVYKGHHKGPLKLVEEIIPKKK